MGPNYPGTTDGTFMALKFVVALVALFAASSDAFAAPASMVAVSPRTGAVTMFGGSKKAAPKVVARFRALSQEGRVRTD